MSRSHLINRGTWPVHLTGVSAMVAVGALLHVLWLQPALRRADELREVGRETSAVESDLENARRSQVALNGRFTTVQDELADVRLQLQPRDALNRRLADIVALAGSTGLDVSESRAEDGSTGRWYDTVPIRLQGRGRFSDGLTFLERLHKELSDVDVVGFDLARAAGDATGHGSFRFDLAWYAAPAGSAIVDASDSR